MSDATTTPMTPTPTTTTTTPTPTTTPPTSTAASPTTSSTTPTTTTTTGSSTPTASTATSGRRRRRVMELKCSEVRWFTKREGETKWSPMCGYDSFIIEVAWRLKNSVPLDEYAVEAVTGLPKTEDVIVLQGLYRLSDDSTHVEAVYWKDDPIPIRRGSWFQSDMQPLAMDLASAIEKHHLKNFNNQSIPNGPVFSEAETSKRPVLTTLTWNETEEIKWNSVIDVVWYNNSKTSRLLRFMTRAKGTVLKRGYTEETNPDDGRPNVSHLILVVHGIGQKGYENLIAKNTTQMREVIHQIMDKYYPEEDSRPMILPIEWRSSLVLDNGITDVCTLPRMPNMRHMLNSVGFDIMYYQSPLYRSEIINGVIRSMNSTYSKFMKNNPNYGGKVSIVAHSLGSVIAYDILTNWSPLLLYDEYVTNAIQEYLDHGDITDVERDVLSGFHASRKKVFEQQAKVRTILTCMDEPLLFTVENLFAIGSPLAIFLIMRGIDYTKVLPASDHVKHIFNIFHPYDPVAYRLEPLYHGNYRNIRPVKLAYYSDERAKKSYANLPYELHKSYIRKIKKAQKIQKDAKASEKKEPTFDEKDEDSDDEDEDELSTGSSPRSCSPVLTEEAAIRINRIPPELPPPPTSQSKHWFKFGGTTSTVAPAPAPAPTPTADDHADTHSIEMGREADSGGSISSVSPVPANNPVAIPAKQVPLTQVEVLVDEIPVERRLQSNLPSDFQRLDFFLQPGLTDKSYWSVFKSHFAYWQNFDLIAFMLNVLHPEQPPPPPQPSVVDTDA